MKDITISYFSTLLAMWMYLWQWLKQNKIRVLYLIFPSQTFNHYIPGEKFETQKVSDFPSIQEEIGFILLPATIKIFSKWNNCFLDAGYQATKDSDSWEQKQMSWALPLPQLITSRVSKLQHSRETHAKASRYSEFRKWSWESRDEGGENLQDRRETRN